MEAWERAVHKKKTTESAKPHSSNNEGAISKASKDNNTAMINPLVSPVENGPATPSCGIKSESQVPPNAGSSIFGKVVDPNHFPTQLYKMLHDIDNNSGDAEGLVEGRAFSSVVSWQPHGKCLLIHDEDKFSKYVLTKYFCRLKFTSFQRQLHFYGFKRLCKQGPDKGAYYHDMFVRGMPELATFIERIKSTKGMRGRKRKSQDQEPDFYKQTNLTVEKSLAKKTTSGSVAGASLEAPKRGFSTAFLTSDMNDLRRLEPSVVVQARDMTLEGDFHGVSESKEGEGDLCATANSFAKAASCLELSSVQQILHGASSMQDSNCLNRLSSHRSSGNVDPLSSSLVNQALQSEDDAWQMGMLYGSAMGREGLHNGHATSSSVPLTLPLHTSDLDQSNSFVRQGHHMELPTSTEQQQHLYRQQADMEDHLQEHILRQMEEQTRHQQFLFGGQHAHRFQPQQGHSLQSPFPELPNGAMFATNQQQQIQESLTIEPFSLQAGLLQQHQDELFELVSLRDQHQSYSGDDFVGILLDTYC